MSRNPVEGKVDEYVVLYTPQVRQKQKKWHDGTAKFHHFNNLLVLYDDANHKIDSTFLGRGRVLETGEELQIDNHLVSLEDLTKTTTRDISGIYTRESNTGMGSNNPPTPRVLHQTSLPQVPETTKALSNVSKRLKLSLATPVRTSTKTGTLGPTRLVLEQVSETPFKPPKAPGSTSTPAELRTSVTHLRNQLSNSPSTPTRCYNFEGEGEVVETTPRRSPATSPVQSRARTPSTVPKIISAAPNPLAPFRKPSSARDTILNTEPAPPIESVTVRARRAGIAPPPANNDQLTVREALAFSAIDTRRRSPSPDFDLDDLHDYPGLENDFPGLENDFPEYDFPGVDFPEPENDYPGVDQDIGSVKAEPLSPTFQVKEEPLSPVFGAQTRAFDADIDILSQMQVTIDDSDGDEGMDSFARTTEVIDLISDDEDEEDGVQAGLMSPFKATGERIHVPGQIITLPIPSGISKRYHTG
ncbi:Protein ZGRF1 [Yarrowia sp. B02]|nr:Protein ZGRF1 [Yarrowia sp. B02]